MNESPGHAADAQFPGAQTTLSAPTTSALLPLSVPAVADLQVVRCFLVSRVNVRELQSINGEAWLALRSALWPRCTSERHATEMHDYFSQGGLLATFIAADSDGQLCGFIEASLRPSAEAARGCVELASDCHSDNQTSIHFHRRLGFDVGKQIIYFRRATPMRSETRKLVPRAHRP
jgi:aminoglycoside 6'-N-acetyltransferase I